MSTSASIKRQLTLLTVSFVYVFAVSFVLILYERNAKAARGELVKENADEPGQVQGIKIGGEYRVYASKVFGEALSVIDRRENNEPVENWETNNIYQSLLNMSVPEPYQDIHFKLVRLARALEANDITLALELKYKLLQDHSWLK